MAHYVDTLLLEATIRAEELQHPIMDTVFLGGGTPSLLPAVLLDKLLAGLRSLFPFSENVEFTSEANPGTITAEWLEIAVKHGVNRLSLGMQAVQPELLRILGRIHDQHQVERSVSMARSAGIGNISLDLMFGLPGQTLAQWHESLNAALSLRPKHLSCYGLIPEEGTPLKTDLEAGVLALPAEETERQMYDDTLSILSRHGFQQYEISNFSLPGFECRHNLGYWRQVPYLGLGASASSMLPAVNDAVYIRATNPASLAEYFSMVEESRWTMRETIPISHAEARFETLMLGLRTTQGVCEASFESLHGIPLRSVYGDRLYSLAQRDLIAFINGWWRLTRRGMDVQNAILVELMDD